MNISKRNEELLREASAFGDEDGVHALIEAGADVNAQHSLNGWTALHWAAKRGHFAVVKCLLANGADPSLKSLYGESAFAVAKNDEIRDLLSGSTDHTTESQNSTPLPITPNYLANPPLAAKVQLQEYKNPHISSIATSDMANKNMQGFEEELVLKVRTNNPPDQDFIEVEIPLKNLSYENVFRICCEELQVMPQNVVKLRKLPNTVIRKDKDVQRFQNFQELELVMIGTCKPQMTKSYTSNSVARLEINGYERNNCDVSNSPLVSNSSYCKNGTILY